MRKLLLTLAITWGYLVLATVAADKVPLRCPPEAVLPNPELKGKIKFTFDGSTTVEISENAAEDIMILAREVIETEGGLTFLGNVSVEFKAANGEKIRITADKLIVEQ